jgi:hypothetical protein
MDNNKSLKLHNENPYEPKKMTMKRDQPNIFRISSSNPYDVSGVSRGVKSSGTKSSAKL